MAFNAQDPFETLAGNVETPAGNVTDIAGNVADVVPQPKVWTQQDVDKFNATIREASPDFKDPMDMLNDENDYLLSTMDAPIIMPQAPQVHKTDQDTINSVTQTNREVGTQKQTRQQHLDTAVQELFDRESDKKNTAEDYMHTGLEQQGTKERTSQFGVTTTRDKLREGETRREQASRVLNGIWNTMEKTNSVYQRDSEVMKAITPFAWNTGENSGAVKYFDDSTPELFKNSVARMMQYYKAKNKQGKRVPVTGLKNARIKDWNRMAATQKGIEAGMKPITKYEDYKKQHVFDKTKAKNYK